MMHRVAISLTYLALFVLGNNASASDVLRHNPFQQPDMKTGRFQKNANNMSGDEMKLRGTVIDGNDSLVNIDGKFYRLNQEIAGYRVTRIQSASVTLRRGINETVLTLNNDE